MKKWILILTCLLALAAHARAGEPNAVAEPNEPAILPVNDFTVRILTEPTNSGTNIEGWLGYRKDNSELGGILGYVDELTQEDASLLVGCFTAFHFPDLRSRIENIFWPVEYLPAELEATPSVGASLVYNTEKKLIRTSPFAAVRVYKSFEIQTNYDFFANSEGQDNGLRVGISADGQDIIGFFKALFTPRPILE